MFHCFFIDLLYYNSGFINETAIELTETVKYMIRTLMNVEMLLSNKCFHGNFLFSLMKATALMVRFS